MIHNPIPSRDDLSEPLRSIVEDLANEPVPEELIEAARSMALPGKRKGRGSISHHALRKASGRAAQRMPATRTNIPARRSLSAVLVSFLALGICLMALLVREKPAEPERDIAKVIQPVPLEQSQELPPPSLWAYRQAATSPEGLDELLIQHAAALLPTGEEIFLRPFSRKDEL